MPTATAMRSYTTRIVDVVTVGMGSSIHSDWPRQCTDSRLCRDLCSGHRVGSDQMLWRGAARRVGFVDRNMEAGLLELFFHIQPATVLQVSKNGPHPGNLMLRHAFLAYVDGLPGEVGRRCISKSRGRIAVVTRQMPLEIYRAYSGGNEERMSKNAVMGARNVA